MKKNICAFIGVALLFVLLVLIRAFEDTLFYDPFLAYFQGNFLTQKFPDYDFWKLVLSHAFRYGLNTFISLGIIYIFFRNSEVIKLSVYAYLIAFAVLMPAYFWLLYHSSPDNYLLLFYVRRFLIHPVFVLILIPAFYYQDKKHQNA